MTTDLEVHRIPHKSGGPDPFLISGQFMMFASFLNRHVNMIHAATWGHSPSPFVSLHRIRENNCRTMHVIRQASNQTRGTYQTSEYASREVSAATIDLSVGQPSPSLLPLAAIRASAADRLRGGTGTSDDGGREDAALILQYGPRQGYPSFRRDLAEFLTSRYGGKHPSDADSIMTTAGQSVFMVLNAIIQVCEKSLQTCDSSCIQV